LDSNQVVYVKMKQVEDKPTWCPTFQTQHHLLALEQVGSLIEVQVNHLGKQGGFRQAIAGGVCLGFGL
jgi:hypothetical protein